MYNRPDLIPPETFTPGASYLWQARHTRGRVRALLPVLFLAYDPCPAFVIVQNREGVRVRCPRAELYNRALSE